MGQRPTWKWPAFLLRNGASRNSRAAQSIAAIPHSCDQRGPSAPRLGRIQRHACGASFCPRFAPRLEVRMAITGEQVKAARQLLKWSQYRLASESRASVGAGGIGLFERGQRQPSMHILLAIQGALEAAGVEFVEGEPGVRLRKAQT